MLEERKKVITGLVSGIGFGDVKTRGTGIPPEVIKLGAAWKSMLDRTTERWAKKYPSYIGCHVDPAFLKLSDFMRWAFEQHGWSEAEFQLDKDILVKGNLRYGPDTCVFLPREINSLLTSSRRNRGSLPIGVVRESKWKGFRAHCMVNKSRKIVGGLSDPIEAFNVYKAMKEAEIKRVARVWRDRIDPRAYAALMAYQVEITD